MKPPFNVNSPAWHCLSEDERYLLIQPVCANLRNNYASLRSINYVTHNPDRIVVCTCLPAGTLIKEIPSEFSGIPVEQDAIRETMDVYLATFFKVLEHLAGWSRARIGEVANDKHHAFTNPVGTHFDAASYVAGHLVSAKLSKIRGFAAIEICRRIEHELRVGVSHKQFIGFPGEDPSYDWKAAKIRVAVANAVMEQSYLK